MPVRLMLAALTVSRDRLASAGVCVGKFTHSKKFRVQVTFLDYLANYAQCKVWVKGSSEMSFLYGNHVLKTGLSRITEGTGKNQAVMVLNERDVPLGFGVTARSALDCAVALPHDIVVLNQADIGSYLRDEAHHPPRPCEGDGGVLEHEGVCWYCECATRVNAKSGHTLSLDTARTLEGTLPFPSHSSVSAPVDAASLPCGSKLVRHELLGGKAKSLGEARAALAAGAETDECDRKGRAPIAVGGGSGPGRPVWKLHDVTEASETGDEVLQRERVSAAAFMQFLKALPVVHAQSQVDEAGLAGDEAWAFGPRCLVRRDREVMVRGDEKGEQELVEGKENKEKRRRVVPKLRNDGPAECNQRRSAPSLARKVLASSRLRAAAAPRPREASCAANNGAPDTPREEPFSTSPQPITALHRDEELLRMLAGDDTTSPTSPIQRRSSHPVIKRPAHMPYVPPQRATSLPQKRVDAPLARHPDAQQLPRHLRSIQALTDLQLSVPTASMAEVETLRRGGQLQRSRPQRQCLLPVSSPSLEAYRRGLLLALEEEVNLQLQALAPALWRLLLRWQHSGDASSAVSVMTHAGSEGHLLLVSGGVHGFTRQHPSARYFLRFEHADQVARHAAELARDDLWLVGRRAHCQSLVAGDDRLRTVPSLSLVRALYHGVSPHSGVLEVAPIGRLDRSLWRAECQDLVAVRCLSLPLELLCLTALLPRPDAAEPAVMHVIAGADNAGHMDACELPARMESHLEELSSSATVTLNAEQRQAIQFCVGWARASPHSPSPPTSRLLLLHGAFGTAKTFTLAQAIVAMQLVQPALRILVAAGTNAAVDNVLLALLRLGFGDIGRVGNLRRVHPALVPYTATGIRRVAHQAAARQAASDNSDMVLDARELESLLRGREGSAADRASWRTALDALRHDRKRFTLEMLRQRRVIGVTCCSLGNEVLNGQRFGVIAVDEASQIAEPAAVAPLLLLGEAHACVLLAGDTQQLPPVLAPARQNSAGEAQRASAGAVSLPSVHCPHRLPAGLRRARAQRHRGGGAPAAAADHAAGLPTAGRRSRMRPVRAQPAKRVGGAMHRPPGTRDAVHRIGARR
eukprot:ctg_562.g268